MPEIRNVVATTAISLLMLPALVACSQMRSDLDEVEEVSRGPEEVISPGKTPEPGPGLQRLADIARSDLGAKLDVDAEDIDIVEAAYVTWRDSSIGCPRPETQYMQVLTNGARLVLRANGVLYHYHSGGNRAPFLCAKPSPKGPLPYAPGEA
jgi:hypothetical protein